MLLRIKSHMESLLSLYKQCKLINNISESHSSNSRCNHHNHNYHQVCCIFHLRMLVIIQCSSCMPIIMLLHLPNMCFNKTYSNNKSLNKRRRMSLSILITDRMQPWKLRMMSSKRITKIWSRRILVFSRRFCECSSSNSSLRRRRYCVRRSSQSRNNCYSHNSKSSNNCRLNSNNNSCKLQTNSLSLTQLWYNHNSSIKL